MSRRRIGMGAVAVATALVAALVSPNGAADAVSDAALDENRAAPNWTYSADEAIPDGDIVARSIGESVSLAEAERRLRADRAASALQDEAQARWPQTFAGLWIDHAPYRVNVAFTENAAANVAELAGDFAYPADLRAVTATRSLDALTSLQGALAHERSALQEGRPAAGTPAAIKATNGEYDLDVDVRSGDVVVRVARPTAQLRSAFVARHGRSVVVTGGKSQARTCTQSDCRYAMMGGLRLGIGSSYCSSAFTAYNGTTRYVLSAGHCTDSAYPDRTNGGAVYGRSNLSRLAYEVDAERVVKTNTTWRESSKFIVQGETYPRMVNTVTTHASMAIGAYIGKTGVRTGTTRGYITSKTVAPSYVPNARNFVQADLCSDGGDSGSAIWSGNSAYGILSGGPVAQCRNINGTLITHSSPSAGPTIFGAISYATTSLSVSILTGVNVRPAAEFTHSCLLLQCSFDGSASSDDDGGVTSWAWDFGDGTTGTGRTTTHNYTLPGLYTVTLTVKDNNGATAVKSAGTVVYAS